MMPRLRLLRWRRLGLSLAALALLLQAAVPLFILLDLRALAAEEAADAIAGQSLCIHDGTSRPAPAHPCEMAVCPLCAALAVAATFATPAPAAPDVPRIVVAVSFAIPVATAAPQEALAVAYRSRAPPLA